MPLYPISIYKSFRAYIKVEFHSGRLCVLATQTPQLLFGYPCFVPSTPNAIDSPIHLIFFNALQRNLQM